MKLKQVYMIGLLFGWVFFNPGSVVFVCKGGKEAWLVIESTEMLGLIDSALLWRLTKIDELDVRVEICS